MQELIKLNIIQLSLAYLFPLLLFVILKKRGLKREWELLLATFRMTVQLVLAGYILVYIFVKATLGLTLLSFFIMEIFAVLTVIRKFQKDQMPKGMKRTVAFAVFTGTFLSLIYFVFVVIGVQPWYEPRYLIPLAGMIVGNSMTGVALALRLLLDGMKKNRVVVEEILILGGSPKEAAKEVVNSAFEAAIMPTITSMMSAGIVILPGMMTGQILAGASPLVAISYQLAIMLAILGSVALSVIIMLSIGYRLYFNSEAQLKK